MYPCDAHGVGGRVLPSPSAVAQSSTGTRAEGDWEVPDMVCYSLIVFGFFASGFLYFTTFKLRKQLSPHILYFQIKIHIRSMPSNKGLPKNCD